MMKRLERQREDLQFRILTLIERHPQMSQRDLAREIGVSLGSVNHCLRILLANGLIKLAELQAAQHKLCHSCSLTLAGIAQRRQLRPGYVERRRAQFEAIKAELEQLQDDRTASTDRAVR